MAGQLQHLHLPTYLAVLCLENSALDLEADLVPSDMYGQRAAEKARNFITVFKTNNSSGNAAFYFWLSDAVWEL